MRFLASLSPLDLTVFGTVDKRSNMGLAALCSMERRSIDGPSNAYFHGLKFGAADGSILRQFMVKYCSTSGLCCVCAKPNECIVSWINVPNTWQVVATLITLTSDCRPSGESAQTPGPRLGTSR
uniref:Uncharacterized protein n=1 Tax=Romanomermis culicivorax TaxID=13658 RepID=A0A915HF94_ROMCU